MPIFPIWVEPETDPGSQSHAYNALRPPRLSPCRADGDFLTFSPPQPRFLGSDRPKYRPARVLVELWRSRVCVVFSRHRACRPTEAAMRRASGDDRRWQREPRVMRRVPGAVFEWYGRLAREWPGQLFVGVPKAREAAGMRGANAKRQTRPAVGAPSCRFATRTDELSGPPARRLGRIKAVPRWPWGNVGRRGCRARRRSPRRSARRPAPKPGR